MSNRRIKSDAGRLNLHNQIHTVLIEKISLLPTI